ncbi:MAG TPA: hypothetical protein VEZ40_06205, partial [Pyrinomonadaceae bacterium]|nr:hypothetical protein [Pyrinomonadaceae bacterium]
NKGANDTIKLVSSEGSVSIERPLLAELVNQLTRPSVLFSKIKMDKVELRGCLKSKAVCVPKGQLRIARPLMAGMVNVPFDSESRRDD